MSDFKESSVYRQGEYHRRVADLLMNPETKFTELADFARRHGLSVHFHFTPIAGLEHCELCNGRKGGTAGNNQIINGRAVCDYCHADGSGDAGYDLKAE